MGVTKDVFWHLTTRQFNAYKKAYSLQQEQRAKRDKYNAWVSGQYMAHAIMCTIGNSSWFKAKGTKAHKYPDCPIKEEKPYDSSKELTEKEKQKYREALFAKLNVMKANFEINKASREE